MREDLALDTADGLDPGLLLGGRALEQGHAVLPALVLRPVERRPIGVPHEQLDASLLEEERDARRVPIARAGVQRGAPVLGHLGRVGV